ncbi:hypothetical protein SDC9_209893 [bioreactor metagenome]|uniref:Uncharacterized protein n=1 Tax=bioreactor metagenome TaxID=1076179 RepID=A0A645JF91_9ZZZZ
MDSKISLLHIEDFVSEDKGLYVFLKLQPADHRSPYNSKDDANQNIGYSYPPVEYAGQQQN